ncbi:MAG: FAD:protein FMN transferase [Flavobacteriales bacterium]|nr:FAD:protein FMN transferase [Flavobacteriales bacterium]
MRNSILALAALVLFGCAGATRKQATGYTQGTTYSIIYYTNGADVQYQIDSLLLAFDRVLSTYQKSSYISKWNRNETAGLEQPQMFKEVVNRALEINAATDGALDITVSPLMKYWFERDWSTSHVDSADVDSVLAHVGMNLIRLDGSDYVKIDSNVQLDVNAIAQGYSVDVVSRYLESLGIYDYLVEIGGELRASGRKPDGEWSVGIDEPNEGSVSHEATISINLNDKAMATSGNYRKFVEIDGVKYGHSLNPRTGFPAMTDVLSATIIANDCMTADAYATACMVLGFGKAQKLVSENKELNGILIYSQGDGSVSTWKSEAD